VVWRLERLLGGRGAVEPEGVCPVTGLVVDALLPARRLGGGWAGPQPLGVAVEVDGPTHFFRGKAARAAGRRGGGAPGGGDPAPPTPSTALKRRLLGAAGWAVISIDAAAWSGLDSAGAEAVLLGELRRVGVCVGKEADR